MAKQPRILVGQVAAITGAARGIGKATAQAFAREGMKVAIGDVDAELADQAAAEMGPNVAGFALDVTKRDSFEAFIDAAEERFGPLDVLVNNAGIMPVGRFLDEDEATAVRMVDINLHGVIHGMKIALPRMMARNRGHVVNIASQAGKYGAPGGATYSATKHAVIGLTEAVRGELHIEGSAVELSYVMPFVVKTELGVGTEDARGMKKLEPSDVADAIREAAEGMRVQTARGLVGTDASVGVASLVGAGSPGRVFADAGLAMAARESATGAGRFVRRRAESAAARR